MAISCAIFLTLSVRLLNAIDNVNITTIDRQNPKKNNIFTGDAIPNAFATTFNNLGNIASTNTHIHTKSHNNAYLKSMLFFLT